MYTNVGMKMSIRTKAIMDIIFLVFGRTEEKIVLYTALRNAPKTYDIYKRILFHQREYFPDSTIFQNILVVYYFLLIHLSMKLGLRKTHFQLSQERFDCC